MNEKCSTFHDFEFYYNFFNIKILYYFSAMEAVLTPFFPIVTIILELLLLL